MAAISDEKYLRLKNRYHRDVALHLSQLASRRAVITYAELSELFGRGPRNWGQPLCGITIRCHDNGLPLLPVIVVNKSTGLPSRDAVLYEHLGLDTIDLQAEQIRCFDFDWVTARNILES